MTAGRALPMMDDHVQRYTTTGYQHICAIDPLMSLADLAGKYDSVPPPSKPQLRFADRRAVCSVLCSTAVRILVLARSRLLALAQGHCVPTAPYDLGPLDIQDGT